MNVSVADLNQTPEYRSATAVVRLLPTGLLLIFLGLWAKARQQQKYWEEAVRKQKEESKRPESRGQGEQRFEQDMRRVFGR